MYTIIYRQNTNITNKRLKKRVERKISLIINIHLAIVEEVANTSIKTLPVWHGLPMVMRGVKLLHEPAAHLQWSVDVQVLVEGRDGASSLAAGVVELWRCAVLEL